MRGAAIWATEKLVWKRTGTEIYPQTTVGLVQKKELLQGKDNITQRVYILLQEKSNLEKCSSLLQGMGNWISNKLMIGGTKIKYTINKQEYYNLHLLENVDKKITSRSQILIYKQIMKRDLNKSITQGN